jgi:REP element-mobilizing transposase RayT
MSYNPDKHHRKTIRLKGYDYSQAGLYFITIVLYQRACLFGEVVSGDGAETVRADRAVAVRADKAVAVRAEDFLPIPNLPIPNLSETPNLLTPETPKQNLQHKPHMQLSPLGKVANDCWLQIPAHFPNVTLHEHVVMPNHIHGIVQINYNGEVKNSAQKHEFQRMIPRSISSIVKGFKIGVTKWYRNNITQIGDDTKPLWHRNYYENIVRDERAYQNIANYINNNPTKWYEDKFYLKTSRK